MAQSFVNWYSGTLKRYESITSIGAKFCYLNHVSREHFLKLLKDTNSRSDLNFRNLDPRYSSCRILHANAIPYFRVDSFNEAVLARTLSEPLKVVQSSRLPVLLPLVQNLYLDEHETQPFQFCPICASVGYHATFHLLPWFKKCLIHSENLQIIYTNHRNKYLRDGMSDLISTLYDLYFGENSKWNYRRHISWTKRSGNKPYQIVDEYANWINSIDVLKFAAQPQFFYYFDFSCLRNGVALQVADFLRMTCSTSLNSPKFLSYLIPGEMSPAPHKYSYSLQNTRSKKHVKNSFFDFSEFKIMLQDRVNEIELTGEHSIWKSQNDLIEANMVAKHLECSEIAYVVDRAAYHAFLDSKSGLLEFQNICPRLIIASIFLNKSSVLFRNDFWTTKITFQQYQLDEQVKLFIKKGIYTRARLKDVFKGIKDGQKNSNQRIVQLLYPWNKIADEILQECFLSAAWLVWDLERSKREVINKEMDLFNNFFFRKKIYPIIHLSVDPNGNVILQIWQRYPEHLPDWDLLEIDPVEHAAQLSTWESKCLIEIRESELKHPRGV